MANVADSIKIFTLLPAWAAVVINSDISSMIDGMNRAEKNIIGILSAADGLSHDVFNILWQISKRIQKLPIQYPKILSIVKQKDSFQNFF